MARILKPGGQVFVRGGADGSSFKDQAAFTSALKLSGFVDVEKVSGHNDKAFFV